MLRGTGGVSSDRNVRSETCFWIVLQTMSDMSSGFFMLRLQTPNSLRSFRDSVRETEAQTRWLLRNTGEYERERENDS